jgi:hypothetical protein
VVVVDDLWCLSLSRRPEWRLKARCEARLVSPESWPLVRLLLALLPVHGMILKNSYE